MCIALDLKMKDWRRGSSAQDRYRGQTASPRRGVNRTLKVTGPPGATLLLAVGTKWKSPPMTQTTALRGWPVQIQNSDALRCS